MNLEEAIGEYEFSAVPRSLFASDGTLLLPSDKYELMKQTENIAVPNPQNMDEYQTTPESTYRADVIDAMVQVQAMKKDSTIKTGKDFGNAFAKRIERLFSNSDEGRVIFDRHIEGSFKGQTRRKWTKGADPIRYNVSDTMDMKNILMKSLLSHTETKSELTFFLKDKVLQNYSSSTKKVITVCGTKTESNLPIDPTPPVHNHEEADTLIPLHCLDVSSSSPGCSIYVHSVDTDVYILLLDIFNELQTDELYMITGKGQNTREISIKDRAAALGEAKTGAFLGLHAMSGTDWGGKFATISKKAWVKSFLELDDNDEILDALSSLGATQERPVSRVCAILEKFTCMVYAPKSSKRTLAELRWELFRLKEREGEKVPPTLSSFLPHLWRANYVAMVCKSSRHHVSELPSPLLHGGKL